MILTDKDTEARMNSPLNLLNRLRKETEKTEIVSLPPTVESLIPDANDKLSGTAKQKAISVMNACLDELKNRVPEVTKPEKLAEVAERMSKIVNAPSVRIEDNRRQAQIIIYSPQTLREDQFEVIHANE